eukprot:scaffold195595_cov20-Tisochrysis_lutea.AAC.1
MCICADILHALGINALTMDVPDAQVYESFVTLGHRLPPPQALLVDGGHFNWLFNRAWLKSTKFSHSREGDYTLVEINQFSFRSLKDWSSLDGYLLISIVPCLTAIVKFCLFVLPFVTFAEGTDAALRIGFPLNNDALSKHGQAADHCLTSACMYLHLPEGLVKQRARMGMLL